VETLEALTPAGHSQAAMHTCDEGGTMSRREREATAAQNPTASSERAAALHASLDMQ